MAEFITLTEDRGSGFYAGDVVLLGEDGHPWGNAEVGSAACPFFKHVSVPGVPAAALADMVDPVTDGQGRIIVRRRKHFDPAYIRACSKVVSMLELNAARRVKVLP